MNILMLGQAELDPMARAAAPSESCLSSPATQDGSVSGAWGSAPREPGLSGWLGLLQVPDLL